MGPESIESDASVSFSVSGAVSAWVRVDGSEWISVDPNSTEIRVFPGAMVDSEGVHYVEMKAVDRAGNEATKSAQVYISFSGDDVFPQPGGEDSHLEGIINAMGILMVVILGLLMVLLVLSIRRRDYRNPEQKDADGTRKEVNVPGEETEYPEDSGEYGKQDTE